MNKKEYMKGYYLKNKEKQKQKANNYYLNNKNLMKETTKKWRIDNYEAYILSGCKRQAKTRKLDFNLDLDDIKIPEFCSYLQVPLTKIQGEGYQEYNASIDRIDNNKGYIKGNVEIISMKANRMKSNASVEELLMFSKSIQSRYGT